MIIDKLVRNGAAMRILPIALANLGNIEKIKEDIFCN